MLYLYTQNFYNSLSLVSELASETMPLPRKERVSMPALVKERMDTCEGGGLHANEGEDLKACI